MSYTPPTGDQTNLVFPSSYTPPTGDSVPMDLSGAGGATYNENITDGIAIGAAPLPYFTAIATSIAFTPSIASVGFHVHGFVGGLLSDGLVVSDEDAWNLINNLRDSIRSSALMSNTARLHFNFSDSVVVKDSDKLFFLLKAIESVVLTDTPTPQKMLLLLIADTIRLSTSMVPSAVFLKELMETVRIFNTTAPGYLLSIFESATIYDITLAFTKIGVSLVDNPIIADAVEAIRLVNAALLDGTQVVDDLSTQLVGHASLSDGIVCGWLFDFGGDDLYEGWVLNTESLGTGKYTNYPFNSMSRVGGQFWGASADGLYILSGDTDDGDTINAHLFTGKTDFDSPFFKHVREVFIGYSSDQPVVIKTVSSQDGELTERWYTLSPHFTGQDREARVKLGRGVKSRYWQFAIYNVDGGDLDLDRLDFYVVKLGRRVS